MDADDIKELRERLGPPKRKLWRRELADILGVSYHTVVAWESGRRECKGSSAAHLRRLREACDNLERLKEEPPP